MHVYMVGIIKINDHSGYRKYEEGFMEIFSKYKGEVLAVDENPDVFEGTWPYTRTVLLRFPDRDEALRWYNSPPYQKLAKYRHQSSETIAFLMKGAKTN